jgi:hypothetical protein
MIFFSLFCFVTFFHFSFILFIYFLVVMEFESRAFCLLGCLWDLGPAPQPFFTLVISNRVSLFLPGAGFGLQSSCLCFPGAGITGTYQYTQLVGWSNFLPWLAWNYHPDLWLLSSWPISLVICLFLAFSVPRLRNFGHILSLLIIS